MQTVYENSKIIVESSDDSCDVWIKNKETGELYEVYTGSHHRSFTAWIKKASKKVAIKTLRY